MADNLLLKKIISGGQTGVDRAALDAAIDAGFPCGGWCPKGRKAEDGPIARHYPLQEADSPNYGVRTRLNVESSDGTLIVSPGALTGGTAMTAEIAEQLTKPCIVIYTETTSHRDSARAVEEWIDEHRIATLNIAGPRTSVEPAIYIWAYNLTEMLIANQLQCEAHGPDHRSGA